MNFNERFRGRTKQLSIDVILYCEKVNTKRDSSKILEKQLMRSITSVAANFRAVCISRSVRERYAKLCIVTEEADESIYWIEMLESTNFNFKFPESIKQEALEISKVMASYRRKVGKTLAK